MRGQGDCPFCGLIVIKDNEAQTVLHEAPVCAKFHELVHKVGKPEVMVVPEQDVGKTLDAYAEKVKGSRS